MRLLNKDICCGLLFMAIGAVFGYQALFHLQIGTLRSMGPGFFPIVLGAVTIVIGIAVIISGMKACWTEGVAIIPWRGLVTITSAPILFAVMIGPLGMIPSVLALAAAATLASSKTTILSALLTSVTLAAICAGIFVYGLGMPIPLLGPLIVAP
jgi:hypothetical protein